MAKYRKKPVVIEAVCLGWDTWSDVCELVPKEQFGKGVYLNEDTNEILEEGRTSNKFGVLIHTLEGTMLAIQGDYIIKGIKGECYPCKPDIFRASYELVQ